MNVSETKENGATVVITHRVRDGKLSDYENWLNEIAPLVQSFPGHLDWQIVRPVAGLTETYTVIIRFDSSDHLGQWMNSQDRQRLIEKVQPFLAVNDSYTIHTGLDFWFAPESSSVKVPVRWKQFLITWSAIYPLAIIVPLAIVPALHPLGLHENRFVTALLVTGVVVFLMTYVVMPYYTRLIRKWLYS